MLFLKSFYAFFGDVRFRQIVLSKQASRVNGESRKKFAKVISANFITKAKVAFANAFSTNFAYALA